MSKTEISVIVPTHSRSTLLKNTLDSLCNLNYPLENYEILVVDNDSTDNTKEVVEIFIQNYPNIRYIYEPKLGLHNARHAGAKTAGGDILLYIDDDVLVEKNLLYEIVKYYSNPEVGCVGGKILPKWEVEPPEWINLFPKWYLSIIDDEDGPKEVQWIYGCNFSIRRELLFELGGFNPDAFDDKKMWWYRGDGEIGLLRKVHNAGKKVIYNPKAIVWHFIQKERMTIKYFKERAFKSGIEASFSKYRYGNKSFNSAKLLLCSGVFAIYCIFHSILSFLPTNYNIRHKVTSSYYKARCFYELKLTIDKNLQKFLKNEK